MGGNALKHLAPRRLPSAEVVLLTQHLQRLWQLIASQPLSVVPWVAEKEDHGDIDVICAGSAQQVRQLADMAGAVVAHIVRNGSVLSVPVPLPWERSALCQVDFICCTAEAGPAMRFFYAGGDFGMLLGRVAAWHGLVFGMDGLRYRADRDLMWQEDVLLTSDPARVLRLLGYPPVLPWFDTYDTLWRFVLSSPLAGAYQFAPEATNAKNRSRDRQRRKIVDFQDWLRTHYADQLVAPRPRLRPDEARAFVKKRCPEIDLDAILLRQEARFAWRKRQTRLLGLDAVEAVIGTGHTPELTGSIIYDMQALLPPKIERDAALRDPTRHADQVRIARLAALAIARARGLTTQYTVVADLPAFVPEP